MADNRLRLKCIACEAADMPWETRHVTLARLPIGGDWTAPRAGGLGDAIANFINEHRWCDDEFAIGNFALEWESERVICTGATVVAIAPVRRGDE